MISKELLSAVLGVKFGTYFRDWQETEARLWVDNTGSTPYVCWDAVPFVDEINIYELAHKCKEWAVNQGYTLISGRYLYNCEIQKSSCIINLNFTYLDDGEFTTDSYSNLEEFEADTEPAAIFKACQWIYDNK